MDSGHRWRRVWRAALGVALLALLVTQLDLSGLADTLARTDPVWALAAVSLTAASQGVTAWRWRTLANALGFALEGRAALRWVLQGVAANAALPGGVLAGDGWRVAALMRVARRSCATQVARPTQADHSRLAAAADAATSVLLDRVGGLWALALVSLLALLAVATGSGTGAALLASLSGHATVLYAAALSAAVLAPPALGWLARSHRAPTPRVAAIGTHIGLLARTLPQSLLVQLLATLALWCVLEAVDANLDPRVVAATATVIFVAGVLPAAIGGFGAREVAAAATFGALGVPLESAVAASLLYGLTHTLVGLAGVAGWPAAHPGRA